MAKSCGETHLCLLASTFLIVSHTWCRVLTTDVPSDIVVEAGGMNFSLHKVSSGTSFLGNSKIKDLSLSSSSP